MPAPQRVAFEADLRVLDAEGLCDEYRDHHPDIDPEAEVTVQTALEFFTTNAHKDDSAYLIKHVSLEEKGRDEYTLHVTGEILNLAAFKALVVESSESCFGSGDYAQNLDAGELLAELVLISNLSESPYQLGYEIICTFDAEPVSQRDIIKSKHEEGLSL